MDFAALHSQLLILLKTRVRNGEITERGLARLAGLSQPYVHNVLKGTRLFSMASADQMLHALGINLVDLLTADQDGRVRYRLVPVLAGCIGPGCPYPEAVGPEHCSLPAADIQDLISPVAARLVPGAHHGPHFGSGGMVLVDRAEAPRLDPHPDAYFLLDFGADSALGLARRTNHGAYEWAYARGAWQPFPWPDRDPLDLIRGQARLLIQRL
ncbi:MAG TPA: helix-turn-helix transcriptional regulator [Bryobacteraceae bacterium]|nr:helix-turn-helix transcriptional regulator [Bryobacteraceae bacterium]